MEEVTNLYGNDNNSYILMLSHFEDYNGPQNHNILNCQTLLCTAVIIVSIMALLVN